MFTADVRGYDQLPLPLHGLCSSPKGVIKIFKLKVLEEIDSANVDAGCKFDREAVVWIKHRAFRLRVVDIKSQTTVDQNGVVYVGHPPAHIGWVRFYGQMDGLAALESNPDALKSNTRIRGVVRCRSLAQLLCLAGPDCPAFSKPPPIGFELKVGNSGDVNSLGYQRAV